MQEQLHEIKCQEFFKKDADPVPIRARLYNDYLTHGKIVLNLKDAYVGFCLAKGVFEHLASVLGLEEFQRRTTIINAQYKVRKIIECALLEGNERFKKA